MKTWNRAKAGHAGKAARLRAWEARLRKDRGCSRHRAPGAVVCLGPSTGAE